MTRGLITVASLLAFALGSAGAADEPEAKTLSVDSYQGYFVSNRFEPNQATSFMVLRDAEAFGQVFGAGHVKNDHAHRLAANAFDTQLVLGAIKRGKSLYQFTAQSATVAAGVVTLTYTATAGQPHATASFACPLIVSIPHGEYTSVRFVENGHLVRILALTGEPVAYDVYGGYFVSNRFEPDAAESYVALADQKAFDGVFGVAAVMGDHSHRLPKGAFERSLVLSAIKRGSTFWQYQVQSVTVADGVLALSYLTTGKAQDGVTYACPLIVSVPHGEYRSVRFVENGQDVKTLALAAGQ